MEFINYIIENIWMVIVLFSVGMLGGSYIARAHVTYQIKRKNKE